MIPTDTLITTIVADHAAQRDADPQAVIARLKQDLRAARQAATKAGQRVAKLTNGADAVLRDENAVLRAEIQVARDQRANMAIMLKRARQERAEATRRAVHAENERDAAWRENEALRAFKSHTDEPEPASLVFLLGKYPEIRRAYELVESLYSAPDGQYAAVGNRVLAMFSEICEKADPWRKATKGRAA